MNFKVIIAGSREFSDYQFLKEKLDYLLKDVKNHIEVVSGTAEGADQLGERYAKERNYALQQFPADWYGKGKSAGYLRNKQMAGYANALVAFWDGESKGTGHMIDLAKSAGLNVKIVYFKKLA